MELTDTPMTERQRDYRAEYRRRIAGWYNGWLHVLMIYTIGIAATVSSANPFQRVMPMTRSPGV